MEEETTALNENRAIRFKDLKEQINSLTEEQLQREVLLIREYEAVRVLELTVEPEDLYYNENDFEDIGTLEELKMIHGDDFKEEEYRIGRTKGTPYLSEDF